MPINHKMNETVIQTEKRLKQKRYLLRIVEKLYKKDLEEILLKFYASKCGTKDTLKMKVIDFIQNERPDIKWCELRKEIKRVYRQNEKIQKSPKKYKVTKNAQKSDPQEETINNVAKGLTPGGESDTAPLILRIPKQRLIKHKHSVKQNDNYGILSYFNSQTRHLQPNNSPQYSQQSNQQPLEQCFAQQPNASAMPNLVPPVPLLIPERNYPNVCDNRNLSQTNPFPFGNNGVQSNNAFNPVLNPHSLQPTANPNQQNSYNPFIPNLVQPINYSINNNYYQNSAQNYFQQNLFQNQFSDLNSQTYDSFIEEQKLLLSQCSQTLQDKDLTINEEFEFKCLPKFKVIKKLKETKTLGSLSDIGIEIEFNLKVLDLEPNHYMNNSANSVYDLRSLLNTNLQQIQLRFCYITEVQTKEQKDGIPEYLCIDVNNKRIFTYSEDAEMSGPFDLSEYCFFGSNKVKFSMSKPNYTFLLPCIYEISIVGYETPESFLSRLKHNIFQFLDSNSTKQLIKSRGEEQSQDTDENIISVTNTKTTVKLICPLSCRRIETPCRTYLCKHIECFDAFSFFKTNEMRYDWICPICQKRAHFDSLRIDGYFTEVLESTEESITEICIKSDANYDVINSDKSPIVIELDDTVDDYECISDDDCIILD